MQLKLYPRQYGPEKDVVLDADERGATYAPLYVQPHQELSREVRHHRASQRGGIARGICQLFSPEYEHKTIGTRKGQVWQSCGFRGFS